MSSYGQAPAEFNIFIDNFLQKPITMQLLGNSLESGKKIKHYTYNYADLLGRGNFSRVYKGLNTKTHETVAIKIVSLDALKSKHLQDLVYEQIKILQLMDHPSILKFHEALLSDRNCYIVTELCEGGNLEDRILSKQPFTDHEIPNIISDVYQGLRYLREKGVCHRDLKSANIFFKRGRAKIADFGLAKLYNERFKDLDIGSPLYMSPQGLLQNVYGQKTDIWAFGIVIYEMLHGITPFVDCQTEFQLKTAVQRPLPQRKFRSNIHGQLRQLIMSLLTIDEQKRPSVYQLADDPYISSLITNKSSNNKNNLHRLPLPLACKPGHRNNENTDHDKKQGASTTRIDRKLNLVSQSGNTKLIELGGSKFNKSKPPQNPSKHFGHLQGLNHPEEVIGGGLFKVNNIETGNFSGQRVNSSQTITTRQSEEDTFSKRRRDHLRPTLTMK